MPTCFERPQFGHTNGWSFKKVLGLFIRAYATIATRTGPVGDPTGQDRYGHAFCPVCRQANEIGILNSDKLYADNAIGKELTNLEVICPKRCGWRGPFQLYEMVHEGECAHQHEQHSERSSRLWQSERLAAETNIVHRMVQGRLQLVEMVGFHTKETEFFVCARERCNRFLEKMEEEVLKEQNDINFRRELVKNQMDNLRELENMHQLKVATLAGARMMLQHAASGT